MTLNLLRQAKLKPMISAYEFMNGPFDYNATPVGPLGCPIIIHKKTSQRHTWDFRGREGWSIGAAMDSYRCDKVIPHDTLAVTISDTVEYRHDHLTLPSVTPADCILHGLQSLTGALADVPTARCDAQLQAISNLREACTKWQANSPVQDSVGPSTSVPETMSPANVQRSLRLEAQVRHLEASPRSETPVPTIGLHTKIRSQLQGCKK